MTVQDAIERANEMREGNSYSDEIKIKWLSELDGNIYNDVILTHHSDAEKMKNYEEDTNAQLIAPAPYDILYVYWLMAQIDLAAAELNRYNNSMELFNEAMKNFKAWYNRTHRPLPKPAIRLGIDGGG